MMDSQNKEQTTYRFSIVTPTFNSAKTIFTTVDSVLNQSFNGRYEHIIIDGGSTDNTLQIIESKRTEYEAKGIRLKVISEKDNGIYDAMNKGIRLARGEIVGIINSDDWYEKDALRKGVKNGEE